MAEVRENWVDASVLDFFRLETQHLSPEDQAALEREIGKTNSDLLAGFGEFIPDPLSDQEIAKRFLLMDPETHTRFWETMSGQEISEMTPMAGDHIEGVITGMPPTLERTGSDQEELNRYMRYVTFLHEVSHLYQEQSLPPEFFECGAYWYQNKIQQGKFRFRYSQPDQTLQADFYQSLIDKYGADVHRLFFGSLGREARQSSRPVTKPASSTGGVVPVDNAYVRRQQILGEFTPQVRSTLPPPRH